MSNDIAPAALAATFVDRYVKARRTVYRAATVNGSGDAIVRAARIRDEALAAGVVLDLDALELQARP